ncbi:MAG: nitroreductase family protein [Tepidiformaceae bacterium]
MDVFQAMNEMRAMRRLKPDAVPRELLAEIVGYATRAPSGANAQGWKFVVVTDAGQRARIGPIYKRAVDIYLERINTAPLPHQSEDEWQRLKKAVRWQGDHLAEAPVLVFPCLTGLENSDFGRFAVSASTGGSIWPAVQNLLLACRAKGLGATLTTLHLMFESEVDEVLSLPAGVRTFGMVPVGHPMGKFGPTARRPVEEVLVWERWPG